MKLILTNKITLFKLKAWLFGCLQRQWLHCTGFLSKLLPVVPFSGTCSGLCLYFWHIYLYKPASPSKLVTRKKNMFKYSRRLDAVFRHGARILNVQTTVGRWSKKRQLPAWAHPATCHLSPIVRAQWSLSGMNKHWRWNVRKHYRNDIAKKAQTSKHNFWRFVQTKI